MHIYKTDTRYKLDLLAGTITILCRFKLPLSVDLATISCSVCGQCQLKVLMQYPRLYFMLTGLL